MITAPVDDPQAPATRLREGDLLTFAGTFQGALEGARFRVANGGIEPLAKSPYQLIHELRQAATNPVVADRYRRATELLSEWIGSNEIQAAVDGLRGEP